MSQEGWSNWYRSLAKWGTVEVGFLVMAAVILVPIMVPVLAVLAFAWGVGWLAKRVLRVRGAK